MSRFVLVGARVMTEEGLRDGLAVEIADDRIAALIPLEALTGDLPRRDLAGGLLLPGFIDTQVNGGGDVLFNDAPTVETIARIGAAHRRFGTTGFLPTLISDDLRVVEMALTAVRAAQDSGVPGVLGAHIEGPFLSHERQGIHDPGHFRTLDETGLELFERGWGISMLHTLAPEMVDRSAVRRLAAAGVILAAGHTNATYTRMRDGFADGFTGVTHLFNAMSPITSRAPGVVGAALESEAWCGVIVDGRHVDPVTLKLALKCHRLDRFMLVSDAMPCVGGNRHSFLLQGKPIYVRDGACYDDAGTLAGADLDMASAVRNAVGMLGLDLAVASRMASGAPAAFMGLDHETGQIAAGLRADLVLLDDDLTVRETWIGGIDSAGA
ncbi:N-acetylglucosamine-6-phosphate deacetylase [uncultured Sphingomonas sp.]|uniref:N-acetylglucosamine-6-phosphate deacetylase n=1 Tax=uncultured Sphingomonas sp. TaxID=158754 RepID=UPI0035C9A78F